METQKTQSNELELYEKIRGLADRANHKMDLVDLGITLSVAMTEKERADLAAMIDFLYVQAARRTFRNAYVLGEVLHDLAGFKAFYLGAKGSGCFSPWSAGYSDLMKLNPPADDKHETKQIIYAVESTNKNDHCGIQARNVKHYRLYDRAKNEAIEIAVKDGTAPLNVKVDTWLDKTQKVYDSTRGNNETAEALVWITRIEI